VYHKVEVSIVHSLKCCFLDCFKASFKLLLRSIDDSLSLNNSKFDDFVDRIYPIELKIKDTTYTGRSASCLDLHLDIDIVVKLRTIFTTKEIISIFPFNFSVMCINIPAAQGYGVYIPKVYRIPELVVPIMISLT